MKMKCWLLFAAMLSTSLVAQQVTNAPAAPPIETSAPAGAPVRESSSPSGTNAPSLKPVKKKSPPRKKTVKKPAPKKSDAAAELRTVPLVPGPAVVEANHVNVRGQPKLRSEVVTRLNKGDQVTVIQEITLKHSGPDEPSAWAKISLPTGSHAWVNSRFIDPTNKVVVPKKLNLRSGPGENFSVLGQLQHDDPVKELGSKGEWTEIEPPKNACAFIAAQYLKQEAAGALASTTTPKESAPGAGAVSEPVSVAAAPAVNPTTTAPGDSTVPATNAAAQVDNAGTVEPSTKAPAPLVSEEPPPKRIVQREGFVRGSGSIQSPTRYSLVSAANGTLIDYLHTTSPNLDLSRYKGLRIIVTGEEGLDERWANTPVLTIQRIQVLEDFSPVGP